MRLSLSSGRRATHRLLCVPYYRSIDVPSLMENGTSRNQSFPILAMSVDAESELHPENIIVNAFFTHQARYLTRRAIGSLSRTPPITNEGADVSFSFGLLVCRSLRHDGTDNIIQKWPASTRTTSVNRGRDTGGCGSALGRSPAYLEFWTRG